MEKLDPDDLEMMRSVATGEGLVELTPDFQARLLEVFSKYQAEMKTLVTPDRAAFVRQLRVEDYSWRAVARACFEAWDGNWSPPSSQLVGMAICEAAAGHFGEHYLEPPWN